MPTRMPIRELIGTAIDSMMREAGFKIVCLSCRPNPTTGRTTATTIYECDGREVVVTIDEPR
jgi:hypothetical protein